MGFQYFSFKMFNWPWQTRPSIDTKLEAVQIVSEAMEKMHLLLSEDKRTLKFIFQEIEKAEDPHELQVAFAKIDNYFRYLLRVEPHQENYRRDVRTALGNLETSAKFSSYLKSASSLEDTLYRYKTDVLQTLSCHLRKSQEEDILRSNLNKELLQRYFPQLTFTTELKEPIKEKISPERPSFKRRRSEGNSSSYIPSRPRARDTDHDQLRRKNVCIDFQDRRCHRGKGCRFKHFDY